MNTDQIIIKSIKSGQSVAEVAEKLGVSPSAVYLRMRRNGTPIASLEPKKTGVTYRRVKSLGKGYRVGDDGSVQSCVSPRTGGMTKHWRDLSIQYADKRWPFVTIGSSNSDERFRPGVRGLLVEAFGTSVGQQIFERAYGVD